jgi:cyclopropane fatty-acyl-phospholipid synthase-like methyltransferase
MITINISGRLDELRSWMGLIYLLFDRHHANAAGLYTLMSTKNVLSDKTLFINLGYWENAHEYDEACYALARLLADAAGMSQDDAVLDAGFGFGEQDLFWARTFRPASIVGLNVTGLQVEIAARRVRDAGLTDRIRLINGSATDMPIASQSVTKVVALESAFHFQTRQQFFAEAFRNSRHRG